MGKLTLKTKPFPHQIKAVRKAVRKGNFAFFFEPRCGKTKAALDAIAVQHHRGVVQKVVVVAPLIALDVWVDQIRRHLSVPAKVWVVDDDNPVRTSSSAALQFYLINYDKFSRRGVAEVYRNDYIRLVEVWQPDLMVLDESHRVKSAGAIRSQALWRLVKRLRSSRDDGLPWVYLLTGTPNPKGYIDLFSQFRIMDQSILGITAKADFEDEYCTYGVGRRKYTIVKYRNKEKLLGKVRKHSMTVTSKQAHLDGKQFFNRIYITLPDTVRRSYDELANEFITQIEGETMDAANVAVRRLRLLQLTGGFTTGGVQLHAAKILAVKDWLFDLREQGEFVLVYARFLPEVHALTEVCEDLKYPTRTIYGQVKRKDRSRFIAEFQRSDEPRALVFQADSGSLAIELSRAAEQVFYSTPDSWETYYQSLERVRGPHQHRPVRYTHILARSTVDISVLGALRGKRDMHAEMMKHPRDFLFGL